MELYQKLKQTIDWSQPVELQLEALSKFDNISEDDILELANTCHKSFEAGILIEYLGYERLKPHLSLFLQFLQDANWPAASGAAKMLVKAGKEIIPDIRKVITKDPCDLQWVYWILLGIISKFEKKLILILKSDLVSIVERGDNEGISTIALGLLKDQKLLNSSEIEIHYQFLLHEYKDNEYETLELIREIKPNQNEI
jgi:hypothetical protein